MFGGILTSIDEALLLYYRTFELTRPHQRVVDDLHSYMHEEDRGWIFLTGEDRYTYRGTQALEDLVGMHKPTTDPFNDWVTNHVLDIWHSIIGRRVHVSDSLHPDNRNIYNRTLTQPEYRQRETCRSGRHNRLFNRGRSEGHKKLHHHGSKHATDPVDNSLVLRRRHRQTAVDHHRFHSSLLPCSRILHPSNSPRDLQCNSSVSSVPLSKLSILET